jgi:hypothetical protein
LPVQGGAQEECDKASLHRKGAVLEDFAHDVVSQDVRILGDFMFDHRRNFGDVELSLYLAKVVHSLMVAKAANDLARINVFTSIASFCMVPSRCCFLEPNMIALAGNTRRNPCYNGFGDTDIGSVESHKNGSVSCLNVFF